MVGENFEIYWSQIAKNKCTKLFTIVGKVFKFTVNLSYLKVENIFATEKNSNTFLKIVVFQYNFV